MEAEAGPQKLLEGNSHSLFRPSAERAPQKHDLPDMVGVVVSHQHRFAKNGLSIAPGNLRK